VCAAKTLLRSALLTLLRILCLDCFLFDTYPFSPIPDSSPPIIQFLLPERRRRRATEASRCRSRQQGVCVERPRRLDTVAAMADSPCRATGSAGRGSSGGRELRLSKDDGWMCPWPRPRRRPAPSAPRRAPVFLHGGLHPASSVSAAPRPCLPPWWPPPAVRRPYGGRICAQAGDDDGGS
jgi:ribosomal protein L34E